MRLAILADTHMPKGARRMPEACLRELGRAGLIIHLGDFRAASVLAELEAVGPDFRSSTRVARRSDGARPLLRWDSAQSRTAGFP